MSVQPVSDAQCDKIADAILRAAGSSLRHYTMPKSRDDIRAAVRASFTKLMEADNADGN